MSWLKSLWVALADLGPVRIARAICLAYVAMLATTYAGHFWLRDAHGAIMPNDFIDVWAAGRMAVGGHAASAYDWHAHGLAEIAAAGHPFQGYYGWHYPPMFFFVAVLLSCLPYLAAFFAWQAATLPVYVAAVGRIARGGNAWFVACTFPPVVLNIWPGQNGFLSAGLVGATLLLMERRPLLSGVCLGLLTYKPQFGLLFPFVLAFAGQWRAMAAAALTAFCIAAASVLAYGTDTWVAFFHSVPVTTHMLENGLAGWNKQQTVYGLVRWLGGSNRAAWNAYLPVLLASGGAVVALWRSDVPYPLKAAALATATLLATPYLYIYDFPVLAVAIAFLRREQNFDRIELLLLSLVCACLAVYIICAVPIGLGATLLTAAVVARRALMHLSPARDVALQRA